MPKEIENIRIPTKLQHPIPTEPHTSPLFPIKNERKKNSQTTCHLKRHLIFTTPSEIIKQMKSLHEKRRRDKTRRILQLRQARRGNPSPKPTTIIYFAGWKKKADSKGNFYIKNTQ